MPASLKVLVMAIQSDASRRFPVETPEGVIAFFRSMSSEVHKYVSRLTGGDRQLTEDIVQDAFFALVRQSRSGLLIEVEPGWIITTARNRFIDHVRACDRERRRLDANQRTIGDEVDCGWRDTEAGVLSAARATALLASLPDQERWALSLQVVDELSVAEVAGLLGRSVEATTSLLARARRRLRMVVEADDGD
jgi:RNA polymerase sigma-70 factor, ECF subfamily